MEAYRVKFRCGADPEVFLINDDGKHISAIGYIGADKWNPLQIADMPKGFTLQEDNVSLEYGIPPASSGQELYSHLSAVMERSKEFVKGLSFSKLSCTVFTEDQMCDPAAHVFGCEPDLNAYTGEDNPSPQPPHPFMRSAGGHIHVETDKDPFLAVRAMDLFLGVPAVLMDNGELRHSVGYGRAGAMRIKPYGVEYRVLSNFWIFNQRLCQWVWDNTARALENISLTEALPEVPDCINKNDKALAKQLVEFFGLEVVQ